MDKEYLAELQQWREKLDSNLRADYSWLSLIGLFWFEKGENSFGSGIDNKIRLPREKVPEKAGTFYLEDGKVTLKITSGTVLNEEGDPVENGTQLEPDTSPTPTFLYIEDIRMVLIERGERYGLRVWDRSAPQRTSFAGRKWFEPEDEFRVEAHFQPYQDPKMVEIPNVIGDVQESPMDGCLTFNLKGQECSLDVMSLPDGDYYILFTDTSNGQKTYPSGRFLVTEVAQGDKVVIDFNKAYNPPCAFTEYATCPIPPKENHMPVSVEAGESYKGHDKSLII